MKKVIPVLIVIVCLLTVNSKAGSAKGSPFGSLSTANTLGMENGNFCVSVGLADITSVAGSFSYGLSAHTDGRLKVAIVDEEKSDTKFGIGGDFKYQLISMDGINNGPFDMALGAFAEYYDIGSFSAFLLGGHIIGSFPIKLENKKILTPYGRFNIRIESVKIDNPPPLGDDSESNLEFGINAGVKWELTRTIDLYGEFQIDGNDGLFMGIDFNIL